MKSLRLLAFAALLLAASGLASAGVVWDNGGLPLNNAYASDYFGPQFIGGNVTFAAPTLITDAHWWGIYGGSPTQIPPDDFTIRFYQIVGGVPDVNPMPGYDFHVGDVGRTDTGSDLIGTLATFDVYEYMAISPTPILFNPGNYLLSIVNDMRNTPNEWCWGTSQPSGTAWVQYGDGDPWLQGTGELAFQLTDDMIPEPASLLLLGAGLTALARRRRKTA